MNKEKLLLAKISPSTYKFFIILGPHLIILFSILFVFLLNDLQVLLIITCFILTAISFSYYYKLFFNLSSKKSVRLISIDKNNKVVVKGINIDNHPVNILGSSFCNDFFILLNMNDSEGKLFTALITRGCVDAETYRKLKVIVNTLKLSE